MRPYVSQKVAQLTPSATEEMDNEVKRLRRAGVTDLISLAVGEPCFDTPVHIKEAACEALRAGRTKYEPTAGDPELREAIVAKLETENGVRVRPDDVVVTAGAKFAIFLAFQATLSPGDRVVLFDPAWVSYAPAAELAGATVVRVPTHGDEGFAPDLDALRAALDQGIRLVVINSPNNPTGAVYSEAVIAQIADMATASGSYVLSDEIYEYLVFEGLHYSPARDFDNVITVNGFSKSYAMTGWRLGYVTAPSDVVQGMLKVYQHSTSCVTSFAQSGALRALDSADSRRSIDDMVRGYRVRRDALLQMICRSDHLDLPVTPHGAFYAFPRYRRHCDSLDVAKRLLEHAHVAVVPGGAFGPSGEGHLRLSYAAAIPDLVKGLTRIEAYLAGWSRENE